MLVGAFLGAAGHIVDRLGQGLDEWGNAIPQQVAFSLLSRPRAGLPPVGGHSTFHFGGI